MKMSHAKAVFIIGTLLSSVVFLFLTYDSILEMPGRTHEDKLTTQVADGKWTWQKYNCNDCHTILGIGGYYAPDVTKVKSYRDDAWLRSFLRDPARVWPAARKMPNLHLNEGEIAGLVQFLTWVDGIDTNNWPPQPLAVSASNLSPQAAHGQELFKSLGCSACHRIGGIGGSVGPDLSHVGSRRNKAWIEQQMKNPKSHDPDSIMPSFSSVPEKDRGDIADYLSGLR